MTTFTPRITDFAASVQKLFDSIPFYRTLQITLDKIEPGHVTAKMLRQGGVLQQDGFYHAGVLTALADAVGGSAAATLLGKGENIVSVNFAVSLLRPARAEMLRAEGRVIKAGKKFYFAEAEIFADNSDDLLAKASITLTVP